MLDEKNELSALKIFILGEWMMTMVVVVLLLAGILDQESVLQSPLSLSLSPYSLPYNTHSPNADLLSSLSLSLQLKVIQLSVVNAYVTYYPFIYYVLLNIH